MTSDKNTPKFPILVVLIALLIFLPGCVTQKKVEYLQDNSKDIKAFDAPDYSDYRLKANDELYVQITSLDEEAANVFSFEKQQSITTGTVQPYGASLLSYSVDEAGNLLIPIIGSIPVKDKTLAEVSLMLKDSLAHILSHPIVSVKLVNRYVSVLGEVKLPGHFSYSQDKLSIYEALGLAGDITDYGDRNNVVLVRIKDGQNVRVSLDLTSAEILSSEYYNLRPNDIVYVKPLRNKFWGMREFPFAVVFSTITTGLLIYNVMK
jgi:polysaccharide export outer membrane protein